MNGLNLSTINMNERIQELARQAELPITCEYEIPKEFVERFAELLLQEYAQATQEKLLEWMRHQTYSGSSHRTHDMGFDTEPDWLNMDEMTEYLPNELKIIAKKIGASK